MNNCKLLKALKNPIFICELLKARTNFELSELLSSYGIKADKFEVSNLKNMICVAKQNIPRQNKISDDELDEISGGSKYGCKYLSKPFYYTGYVPGYTIGKIPVVGSIVYHSVKSAIIGFYESLHNY